MKVTDFYTKEDVETMWKQYRWKKGKDDYETFLKKLQRFEHIAANHLAGFDSVIPDDLDMEYIKKTGLNDPERPKEWKTRSLFGASSWHYFAYEQLNSNEKEYRRYFKVLNDFTTLS